MTDRNANKNGYKKTKVGWIPKEWKVKKVGSACRIRNELRLPISKEVRKTMRGKYPYYGPTGILDYIDHYRINGNYVLIAEDGDHFLKFTTRPMTLKVRGKFNVNNHAHIIEGTDICNSDWFYQYFIHRNLYVHITRQGAGRYKLNKDALRNIPIPIPFFEEQKMITSILYTWDTAIDRTRSLIAAKKNHKQALMKQLLTGKERLQGYSKPWNKYNLDDLFSERKETNGDHLPLLAITGKRGVIPASEIDRKDLSSADKSRYKRISPGDIGYNTMRMWQGVSAVSSLEGIVSPAYTICKPKKGVNVKFMGYLFKLPSIIHLFWRHSQGLVSDTLNLKFHHFAKIKINIPEEKEQNAIATVLSALEDEIGSQGKKLAALEKQKRGLMQKLLTGEVRVKP